MNKVFVLDTSVVLCDATALSSFDEHDVVVPITVLEELDQFKKGSGVINLQTRVFMRELDRLSEATDIRHWTPIDGDGKGRFRIVTDEVPESKTLSGLGGKKNDHRILSAAMQVAQGEPDRRVVLVSKDINLRVKARSLGLVAEDYETVRIHDIQHLYKGVAEVDLADPLIDMLFEKGSLPVEEILDFVPTANQYLILRGVSKSALGFFNPQRRTVDRISKPSAYGITPRNAEQTFALHAMTRHFPWRQVPSYIAAQLLGATAGAGLLRILMGTGSTLGATVPTGPVAQSIGLEILLTAILMFVIMAVATDTRAVGELAAIAIGATVGLNALWGGPISGASMNPARSWGPALISGTWDSHWIYWLGPVVGGVVGALGYQWIRGQDSSA